MISKCQICLPCYYIKSAFSAEVKKESFIVMAIPRGGVILGDIVASELNVELDIIICKKIGAENNPELAIGAVMADGSYIINEDIVNRINTSFGYISKQVELQKNEIERRLMEFRGNKEYHNKLKDRTIILLDDGIATGATILAAVKWLKEFGSLDNIMGSADKINGKVGENLRTSLTYLPLSKELATIKIDVNLNLHFTDLQLQKPDEEKLKELFQELEFKSWLNELLEKMPATKQDKYASYRTLFSEKELDAYIQELSQKAYFAFDTETTSINYMDAKLVGLCFAHEKTKGVYIPLAHDYLPKARFCLISCCL